LKHSKREIANSKLKKYMKKLIIFLFLFLMFTIVYSQNKSLTSAKVDENLINYQEAGANYYNPTIHNPFAPSGTIPFPINYCDYATDGNNMRRLIVLGDTIIVATDINPDKSGPPPVTTSTRVYYQISYDGGETWLSEAINTSSVVSHRWTNIIPIFYSGSRSIIITGREYYNNSTSSQRGVSLVEVFLGLASFTPYLTPSTYWRDYFGSYKNSSSIGGIISKHPNGSVPTDDLWYMNFNYVTNVYGTPVLIADSLDVNYRYNCDIASNGLNIVAVHWKSTNLWKPQAYYVHESTDGGNTWSAGTMVGNEQTVNGDQCVAWSSFDVIYKPGTTQKCLAFTTLAPSNLPTREGSKILFWSPTVNGGNPVVICDYHKYGFMNDSALWYNNQNNIQVGMTPLSHPSLAYSDDGTRLYCAFSAIQKDTSNYPTGENYHYNRICFCTSVNNGATWSDPYYFTGIPMKDQTYPMKDQTYPTLAKKGNTVNYVGIVYCESNSPGSYTFFDNAPADTIYTIYKKVYVLTDVNNISSEIPKDYTLYQNYPNPFNPTTIIRFQIKDSRFVTIKLFNIVGKEISTLVNGKKQPGTYEVSFDGSNLPSGIYFYSLFADGKIMDTKKMILLK
jgi:hypothetical protein